jgi:hypothetical protein
MEHGNMGKGGECNEREKEEHGLEKWYWEAKKARSGGGNKMEGTPDPYCPFCSAKLTLEHILWQWKETVKERRKSNMTKEVWERGEEGAKMLVEYVKNIGLYYRLQTPRPKERRKNEQETTKETANWPPTKIRIKKEMKWKEKCNRKIGRKVVLHRSHIQVPTQRNVQSSTKGKSDARKPSWDLEKDGGRPTY